MEEQKQRDDFYREYFLKAHDAILLWMLYKSLFKWKKSKS